MSAADRGSGICETCLARGEEVAERETPFLLKLRRTSESNDSRDNFLTGLLSLNAFFGIFSCLGSELPLSCSNVFEPEVDDFKMASPFYLGDSKVSLLSLIWSCEFSPTRSKGIDNLGLLRRISARLAGDGSERSSSREFAS